MKVYAAYPVEQPLLVPEHLSMLLRAALVKCAYVTLAALIAIFKLR